MSTAILKSPTLLQQPMPLREPVPAVAKPAAMVSPVDALKQSIEAEVTARLQAEFDARLDAAREAAREEGYKEGLQSGHEDGLASAADAFKKKQQLLEQLLDKVEGRMEEWLSSVSAEALSVAKEVLVHFLGVQAVDTEALQTLIQRMTAGLRDADVLAIRLHPTECQLLRTAIKQGGAGVTTGSRILDKLVEDPALSVGGAVVDTPRGEYRATLDVQLRKLMGILEAQRAQASASAVAPAVYHARRA